MMNPFFFRIASVSFKISTPLPKSNNKWFQPNPAYCNIFSACLCSEGSNSSKKLAAVQISIKDGPLKDPKLPAKTMIFDDFWIGNMNSAKLIQYNDQLDLAA